MADPNCNVKKKVKPLLVVKPPQRKSARKSAPKTLIQISKKSAEPSSSAPALKATKPVAEKEKKPKEPKAPKEKSKKADASDGAGKEKGGKSAAKDPNAPKKPTNAYNYFSADKRESIKAENPGASFGEIGKLTGDKWKGMTAEEKAPYEAKAAADKARYEREMASYKSGKAISAKEGKAGGAKEAKASKGKGGEDEEEKPKGGKSAPKDPGAPKRPSNSYAIFCAENREKIKQNNMSVSSTDLMKICGEKWKEMTAEEKALYETKAAADKARYEREMASYVPPEGFEAAKKNSKPKKDPTAPAGAKNAFNFFSNEARAKLKESEPTLSFGEVGKRVAAEWNALPAEAKTPYEELAAADKERFQRERAAHEAEHPEAAAASGSKPEKAAKKQKEKASTQVRGVCEGCVEARGREGGAGAGQGRRRRGCSGRREPAPGLGPQRPRATTAGASSTSDASKSAPKAVSASHAALMGGLAPVVSRPPSSNPKRTASASARKGGPSALKGAPPAPAPRRPAPPKESDEESEEDEEPKPKPKAAGKAKGKGGKKKRASSSGSESGSEYGGSSGSDSDAAPKKKTKAVPVGFRKSMRDAGPQPKPMAKKVEPAAKGVKKGGRDKTKGAQDKKKKKTTESAALKTPGSKKRKGGADGTTVKEKRTKVEPSDEWDELKKETAQARSAKIDHRRFSRSAHFSRWQVSTAWEVREPLERGDLVVWFPQAFDVFLAQHEDLVAQAGLVSDTSALADASVGVRFGRILSNTAAAAGEGEGDGAEWTSLHVEELDEETWRSFSADRVVPKPNYEPKGAAVTMPFIEEKTTEVPSYLLRRQDYLDVVSNNWKPGDHFRTPFYDPAYPGIAFWHEGRIFARVPADPDVPDSPWDSLRVMWYNFNKKTGQWYLDYYQDPPAISPWECFDTPLVDAPEPDSLRCLPKNGQKATLKQFIGKVIEAMFDEEFKTLFHRRKETPCLRIDLAEVRAKQAAGRYETWSSFWADVQLMINNVMEAHDFYRHEYRQARPLELPPAPPARSASMPRLTEPSAPGPQAELLSVLVHRAQERYREFFEIDAPAPDAAPDAQGPPLRPPSSRPPEARAYPEPSPSAAAAKRPRKRAQPEAKKGKAKGERKGKKARGGEEAAAAAVPKETADADPDRELEEVGDSQDEGAAAPAPAEASAGASRSAPHDAEAEAEAQAEAEAEEAEEEDNKSKEEDDGGGDVDGEESKSKEEDARSAHADEDLEEQLQQQAELGEFEEPEPAPAEGELEGEAEEAAEAEAEAGEGEGASGAGLRPPGVAGASAGLSWDPMDAGAPGPVELSAL
eukprot:tig00020806_g14045.t1